MKQTIAEKYIKETGDSSIRYEAENGTISFSEEYVEWLTGLIEEQEDENLKLKNEVFEKNNLYDAVIEQRNKQAKEIEELKKENRRLLHKLGYLTA